MKRLRRQGLSLLEVVLAMTILLVSLAALGQLVTTGLNSASRARDLTYAQLLCESKLGELVAGLVPLEPTFDAPVAAYLDDTVENEWLCDVEVNPLPDQPRLFELRVTVKRNPAVAPLPLSYTLVRWIRDPQQIPLPPEPTDATATDTTTTDTSTSGTGTTTP
jgi:hypothetical protein